MVRKYKGNKKRNKNRQVRDALLRLQVIKRFMTEKEYQETIKNIRSGNKR